MFYVYAIYNRSVKKFYIGQTEHLTKRLERHNNHLLGGYTARFPGKWELIYSESVATRPEALKREKQLKSFRGREFIKKHIPEFRQPADQWQEPPLPQPGEDNPE